MTGFCVHGNELRGFREMWGISWLTEDVLAAQEGPCCVELVRQQRRRTAVVCCGAVGDTCAGSAEHVLRPTSYTGVTIMKVTTLPPSRCVCHAHVVTCCK